MQQAEKEKLSGKIKRLLIVDDEPNLLEGLSDYLSGLLPKETDILKAVQGQIAVDILQRFPIDLMIADIQMPGLTGLDLLKEVEKIAPACRVIFLTGYSNFEWIQQALQHPICVDYLLKSQGDEVIGQAVLRQLALLERENDLETLQRNLRVQEHALISYRRREAFLQWMMGNTDHLESLSAENDTMQHLICVFTLRDTEQTDAAFSAMLESLLHAQFGKAQIDLASTAKREYTCMISFSEAAVWTSSALRARFEAIQNGMQEMGNGVNCAYGGKPVSFCLAREKAESLKKILQSVAGNGKEIMVDGDTLDQMVQSDEHAAIQWICQYIADHLSDVNLSLTVIAEKTFYTPSYLSRLFKQQVGLNLSAYIAHVRLEEACRQLREGKLNVREISRAVGFESPCYFSAFFRKNKGCTPVQYMRDLQGTEA